jgi:hypothetical protein
MCASPGLSGQFALALEGVCRALAVHMAANRAVAPLLMLVWARLRRAVSRFGALAARAAAGPLPPPRARSARAGLRPSTPYPRLPDGFGWLIRLVPGLGAYHNRLQYLLGEPEMAALLAAFPQAARILRPLCRMLAVPSATLPPLPARRRAPPATTAPATTPPATTAPAANPLATTTNPAAPLAACPEAPTRAPPRRRPLSRRFRPPRAIAAV